MAGRARFLGVLLGSLIAAGVIASLHSEPTIGPTRATILSECDGAIHSVAIQYVSGADCALPVYAAFLRQLTGDVKVFGICPEQADFRELQAAVARPLTPVIVHHEMTCWSR